MSAAEELAAALIEASAEREAVSTSETASIEDYIDGWDSALELASRAITELQHTHNETEN